MIRIQKLCTTGESLDGGNEVKDRTLTSSVGSGKQFPKGLKLTSATLLQWVNSMCTDLMSRLNYEFTKNKRKVIILFIYS